MGVMCKKVKENENEEFNNYHCKLCGEIPLFNFFYYDYNMICSNHQILNIPFDEFYNYITFNYQCLVCKESSNKNNLSYCFDCDNFFCKKCILNHNQNNYSHSITNNISEKNTLCKLHNKKYNKFCLQCKLNLCEFCENNYNHYTEFFNNIYPLAQDINNFKNLILKLITKNSEEREIINDEIENEEAIFNNNQEYESIKIKSLLIESFSKSITNYNYINNVNNIIRCTFVKDTIIKNLRNEINFIKNFELKSDINNIENKIFIKSISKNITKDYNSQTWCIIKLNDIFINSKQKLELIAIAGSNNKILILDSLKFNIYQMIEEHKSIVFSLAQYKNNFNYLFSSSEDRTINIYKLNIHFKFELIQKLKKSRENVGEISKIIILENKLLISGDNNSITIWKSNIENENNINYKEFFEIIINRDICNLLEVNPFIFIATQFSHGGYFQVYKNDEQNFPLIGELKNIRVVGISSNSLVKIDDNLVCSTAINYFYLISIEPLQIIQKIKISSDKFTQIFYIYVTQDNYLYCKGKYQSIIQYKIIKDEDNNFLELREIGIFKYGNNISFERAILPFDDGRIFYVDEKLGEARYNLIS